MGKNSSIEWTDHTFSMWRGCSRVSPGCDNCYAETWSKRNPKALGVWGDDGTRVIAAEAYWRAPLRWNREAEKAGKRARVFCASLADVFEDRPELVAPRARLARLIVDTPHLDWQLLTKRPENAVRLFATARRDVCLAGGSRSFEWPSNVWLGTTVENQAMADLRIPHLLRVPAAVRFLSCEPLLEAVDVRRWIRHDPTHRGNVIHCGACDALKSIAANENARIHWVILGGESGSHARPFDLAWARSLRDDCAAAGVACFVKQMGAYVVGNDMGLIADCFPSTVRREPIPRAASSDASCRFHLRDKHGGDQAEWPEDLRVREMPR